MTSPERHVYEFGEYRLDTAEHLLLREGQPVPLAPKVFDTLVVLVQHGGHLLTKDQLMHEVWPDTFVDEVNLSVNISTLRKALGETKGRRFIDTVARRGYRFMAAVREVEESDDDLIVHNRIRARIITKEIETDAPDAALLSDTQAEALDTTRSRVAYGNRKLALIALSALVVLVGLAFVFRYFNSRKTASVAAVTVHSMAVLPFKALAQTHDDQYLELGIADELINKLSNLKQVVIRPTSAARRYADSGSDPIVVGKELKVDAVLEGSIQQLGDQIRITARLVSIPEGRALWSGTFDENLKDMFTVEESISTRVAEAVAPQLSGTERALLAKHDSSNPEAHQLYLRGRYFWSKRSEENINKGIEYFQQAIALDPNYAMAYSGLADCYMSLYDFQFLTPGESVPKAMSAAQRALEIDGSLAEAHASVARLHWLFDRDRQSAAREFERSIALNPNYATARQWHGRYLAELGHYDEAIGEMIRAEQLDPLSPVISSNLGVLYFYSQHYDQSIAQLRRTIELEPAFELSHWFLGNALERSKMYVEAVSEYQKALTLQGNSQLAERIGKTFKASGFVPAMRVLLDSFKENEKVAWGLSYSIARYEAIIGDKEQAFAWLEKAHSEHHPWLAQLKVDPQFAVLTSDPRFANLLRLEGLAD